MPAGGESWNKAGSDGRELGRGWSAGSTGNTGLGVVQGGEAAAGGQLHRQG